MALAVYCGAGASAPAPGEHLERRPALVTGRGHRDTHLPALPCRLQGARQSGQAAATGTDERTCAHRALQVHRGVLAILLVVHCGNQLNYLCDTWTPPHTALALPGWAADVARARGAGCPYGRRVSRTSR